MSCATYFTGFMWRILLNTIQMANSCDYGCATLPDHQKVLCADYKTGGISSIAFMECNHGITDFTNPTQWAAAIAAGKVKIAQGVKGEVPEPGSVMVDNPIGRGAAQILIGLDNTLTVMDMNVNVNNDEFYAKLNLRKLFVAIYVPTNDEIRVTSEPVNIAALAVNVPNGNRSLQGYKATMSFFTDAGVIPLELFDAPAGIFE